MRRELQDAESRGRTFWKMKFRAPSECMMRIQSTAHAVVSTTLNPGSLPVKRADAPTESDDASVPVVPITNTRKPHHR